jgi:hypothetical protein
MYHTLFVLSVNRGVSESCVSESWRTASNIRRYRNRIEEANEVTPLFGFDSVVDRYSADCPKVNFYLKRNKWVENNDSSDNSNDVTNYIRK